MKNPEKKAEQFQIVSLTDPKTGEHYQTLYVLRNGDLETWRFFLENQEWKPVRSQTLSKDRS